MKRALPWRKTKNPYAIWISEIMLQQTQVSTVVPYYERWMKKFQTVQSLAGASLTEVFKAWEGLGYYRRARNLHETAKTVCEKFGGKFPDSKEELLKLPGIGRYTAGAVSCIAFGNPDPVLDGNVKRVLARIFALRDPVDTGRGEKKLWEIAENLVKESKSPGDFNQALMELGALVCLPENPQCGVCPVEKSCRAHRMKKEQNFPIKSRNEKMEKLETLATVLWKNGRVLLEKRPLAMRWGGLWMFPYWIYKNGVAENDFLKQRVKKDFGFQLQGLQPKIEIKHGFTKYRVRLRVYEAKCTGETKLNQKGSDPGSDPFWCWIDPKELSQLPLPRPHQKIAKAIQKNA